MTKARYRRLLKSPKWIKRRLQIFHRDGYKCTKCGSSKKLECHHVHYAEDKLPWEVPDSYLTTLCFKCHRLAHVGKTTKDFLILKKRKKPKHIKKLT